MKLLPAYVLLIATFLISFSSDAQQNTTMPLLKVSGEVTKPLSLYMNDLVQLKKSDATMKDRDGNDHTYSGVAIGQLLDMAGATTGKQLRGENLSKYVLVKCADGYEVLFSLAELDSSFTDRNVIIAYETEGKALPAEKGPLRLIVPGEKKPARSSFQVIEIVIGFARD